MVRRYRALEMFCLFLIIILFSMSFFVSAGNAIALRKQEARQNGIINGVRGIEEASELIIENLSKTARQCAVDEFDSFSVFCEQNKHPALSEEELFGYYCIGYYNCLKDAIGKEPAEMCEKLESYIIDSDIKNIRISRENVPKWKYETDANGIIKSIRLEDVSIEYTDPIIGDRSETIGYDFGIPDVLLYTENEELFNYSLVARKGIYITGQTSSIIGNIYAGNHSKEEIRGIEAEYGEIGSFGGLNILSTQLGVEAERIISDGDININGSFVIMSSENKDIACYARKLNSVEGFAKKAMYVLEGSFIPVQSINNNLETDYAHYKSNLSGSFYRLENMELYYDSANDTKYSGPYRKIISNVDVELTEDFTGIIMTPCNVIINSGVNVEGLILCGDRIYVRGDNNIVANRSIALDIIADETENDYEFEAWDYIGGIKHKGITHPQYYVIPKM